jgi:hypothetical protein
LTGNSPPSGLLYHATDARRNGEIFRAGLDLYFQKREVSNPRKSSTMVVCLKVPTTSNAGALMRALDSAESRVPLMCPPYPDGEGRWTCRVWVKEVLRMLQADGLVLQTMDVGELLPPVHSDWGETLANGL